MTRRIPDPELFPDWPSYNSGIPEGTVVEASNDEAFSTYFVGSLFTSIVETTYDTTVVQEPVEHTVLSNFNHFPVHYVQEITGDEVTEIHPDGYPMTTGGGAIRKVLYIRLPQGSEIFYKTNIEGVAHSSFSANMLAKTIFELSGYTSFDAEIAASYSEILESTFQAMGFSQASFVTEVEDDGISKQELYGLLTRMENILENTTDPALMMRSLSSLVNDSEELLPRILKLREILNNTDV